MKIKITLISALFFLLTGCQNKTAAQVKVIAPQKFAETINTTTGPQIIDVRTPEEYAQQHIANAMNIDWYRNDLAEKTADLDKSQPVFVYCMAGSRSRKAAAKLAQLGFTTIYDLDGGIVKWNAGGFGNKQKMTGGMSVAEFDALVNSNESVLVVFSATWCEPCKKMAPYLKKMQIENKDIKMLLLNADEHPTLVSGKTVNELPTVLLYKNHKLFWKHSGYISEGDLKKQLQ